MREEDPAFSIWASGNWQYNWKTPKTYAGTCQEMYIEFARGQNSPVVTFKFT